jgi:hypothetical protein
MLWLAGYVVASERLGRVVLASAAAAGTQPSPYLALLVGLLLFQLIGLVPGIGALVILLAATYGAGGLALYAWRAWRGVPARPEVS